jgi:hypothetical protein
VTLRCVDGTIIWDVTFITFHPGYPDLAEAPRQMQLEFVRHTVATGYAPDGGESVFLLLGEDPRRPAVRLGSGGS